MNRNEDEKSIKIAVAVTTEQFVTKDFGCSSQPAANCRGARQ